MENMNAEWLKQLAPPHAPPALGWWPLAPGWWLLSLIGLLLTAGLIYWYRRKPNRIRRIALRELQQLQTRTCSDMQFASELQNLLRRYAIAAYGRDNVAHLTGAKWLAFVVAHGGADLDGEAGGSFLRAAYGGRFLTDRSPWLKGAQEFLRRRR